MDVGREILSPHTGQAWNISHPGGLLLEKWGKPRAQGQCIKQRVGARCEATRNENL